METGNGPVPVACPTCENDVRFDLPRSSVDLRVEHDSEALPDRPAGRHRVLSKACQNGHPVVVGFHW